MMTDKSDINVIVRDLPTTISGLSSKDENGDYVIILNSKFDNKKRIDTYEHELKHIYARDLEEINDKNACLLEEVRHQYKVDSKNSSNF